MDRVSALFNAFLSSTFGSDELQSYSAEYTWLANQMAHAMMGFFLAAFLSWLASRRAGAATPNMWVAVLPFAIPLLKVGPDALVVWKHSTFPVSWAEFFADKATDLSFWYIGMFGGLYLFFRRNRTRRGWIVGGAILVVWLGLAVWLVTAWTAQKRTFDESDLPPGWVRVSQYQIGQLGDDQTRPAQVDKVNQYLEFVRGGGDGKVRHLIIRGGRAEDRSDLVVAVGTEWAARVKPVRYTTAPRLLEHPDDMLKWAKDVGPDGTPTVVVDDLIALLDPTPAYKAHAAKVATRGAGAVPPDPPSAELRPEEARRLTVLRNLESFRQEAGYKVSTVWAVGGTPKGVRELVEELRLLLEGPDQVVEEIVLGPEPPPGAVDHPPPPPRPKGMKRGGQRY
jgi:hypothetical protein